MLPFHHGQSNDNEHTRAHRQFFQEGDALVGNSIVPFASLNGDRFEKINVLIANVVSSRLRKVTKKARRVLILAIAMTRCRSAFPARPINLRLASHLLISQVIPLSHENRAGYIEVSIYVTYGLRNAKDRVSINEVASELRLCILNRRRANQIAYQRRRGVVRVGSARRITQISPFAQVAFQTLRYSFGMYRGCGGLG